jgi:3-oxoacyl-[acyl-carrier protein] reductase
MSTDSQKLRGKVAIVTGASKGIGAAIATHLGHAGASVVVNYSSSKEGADRVVADITSQGGKAIAVQANVSQKSDIVETEGFHFAGIAGSDFQKTVESQTPLGRIGQPDDIGPVAVFLASEDARWVTGQSVLVSGGQR